ncbi:MAG: transketolase C-terminal domain-containing protein [Gallionella sp.]
MRNRFADTVYQVGAEDHRICALVADISPAGSMVRFQKEFPERFINCGVAEASMIGIAAGLAMRGLRPFCYTIATFSLYRPFEMVRVDLCYQNLPVTVIGMGAGVIYSNLGSTHHTMEDIAVASAIPNMTVLAPCDPDEMGLATRWCATQSKGPVYMRLGKAGEPNLTAKAADPFVLGKVRYLKKGSDVAILSYGITVAMAFDTSKKLEAKGLSVSVLSCHTIKPLDKDGIRQVLESHSRVVVIEEHVPHGGLGSRVKEIAWDMAARCTLNCFSLKDDFIHCYGTHEELLHAHGLSVENVLEVLL